MNRFVMFATAVGMAAAGCARDVESRPAVDGSQYVLTAEPADATDVRAARADSRDGDPITLVGRIGGSENPWVDDRAAFSLVDASLKSCDDIGSDGCPKPWDFC